MQKRVQRWIEWRLNLRFFKRLPRLSLCVLMLTAVSGCASTQVSSSICPPAIWPNLIVEDELEGLKNVEVDAFYFSIIEQQHKLEIIHEQDDDSGDWWRIF